MRNACHASALAPTNLPSCRPSTPTLGTTPRLTYADWLDENGQPEYAEFIRLQCQAARHTDAWSVRRYSEREEWLIGKYGDKWRGHALLAHGRVSKYGTLYFTRFHRGLPDADCYLSNHSSCIERQRETMEILPRHYQVNIVLNIYDWRLWRGSQDPFPLLALPIFSRASESTFTPLVEPNHICPDRTFLWRRSWNMRWSVTLSRISAIESCFLSDSARSLMSPKR